MMIDLGEPKILKGQMAEAIDGIIRGEFSGSNPLEQLTDGFGVHRTWISLCLNLSQFGNGMLLASGSFLSLCWPAPCDTL